TLLVLDARRHAGTVGAVLADADAPPGLRDRAAELLARANQPKTFSELIKAMPLAPARLQGVIAANLANSRPGAEKLLEAVAAGKASARLLQDRTVATRLDRAVPDQKARVAELT